MPSVTLEVQSAELTSKFGSIYGAIHTGEWLLAMKVKLPWRERLELGTGEKPADIAMRLTFRETDPALVDWVAERTKDIKDFFKSDGDKVFGQMNYCAAWSDSDGFNGGPASLGFEVFTPPEVMAALVRFAENGRFPKRVQLEVRGLQYGYAPDGSEKKWPDNQTRAVLPIVSVDFDLPLAEEPEELSPGEPVTPVGADLAPVLNELLKCMKWAVGLLAAIAGAVVLKGWR